MAMLVNSVDPCLSLPVEGVGPNAKLNMMMKMMKMKRAHGSLVVSVVNGEGGQQPLVLSVPPLDVAGLVKGPDVAVELRGGLLRDARLGARR